MNTSGGEIKGTPTQLLEQSSVLADKIPVVFKEITKEITSCYYEFAFSHAMKMANYILVLLQVQQIRFLKVQI